MFEMFIDAVKFNQPIGSWDVRDPRRLERAVRGGLLDDRRASRIVGRARAGRRGRRTGGVAPSSAREAVTSTPPQVSSVTTMEEMFEDADAFNQPIGSWDVRDPCRLEQFSRRGLFDYRRSSRRVGRARARRRRRRPGSVALLGAREANTSAPRRCPA